MKQMILSFSFSLFCFSAHAMVDVSCWQEDCLKNGWTWFDGTSGANISYSCYQDGCEQSGWIIGTDPQTYTQCKDGGCFKVGWYQVDSSTQTLVKEVACRGPIDANNNTSSEDSDCLKYGWVIYGSDASPYGQSGLITCFDSDCANKGWLIQNETLAHAYCKEGGCFVSGWREF